MGSYAVSRPATTMFGVEPMTVHVPPIMQAKESGIKNLVAGMPMRVAQARTTGIIIHTSGVVSTNMDTIAMGTHSRNIA